MDKNNRPLWVRLALAGTSTRSGAVACCLLSLLLGVAVGLGGFWDRRLFVGFMLFIATLGYGLAIRWVDRHGGWK